MRVKFKIWLILMIFGISFHGNTQQDTVFVNEWQLADSVFGELTSNIPTGLLFNRTFLDTTNSFILNAHKKK